MGANRANLERIPERSHLALFVGTSIVPLIITKFETYIKRGVSMKMSEKIRSAMLTVSLLTAYALIIGCEQKLERDSKIRNAVEQVVTKDFKTLERAKRSVGDIEKKLQGRMSQAAEQ